MRLFGAFQTVKYSCSAAAMRSVNHSKSRSLSPAVAYITGQKRRLASPLNRSATHWVSPLQRQHSQQIVSIPSTSSLCSASSSPCHKVAVPVIHLIKVKLVCSSYAGTRYCEPSPIKLSSSSGYLRSNFFQNVLMYCRASLTSSLVSSLGATGNPLYKS